MNILFHIIQYVFYSIVCKESDLREGLHMQKYLVSIIMPTYNRRQIIKDAIDSCLEQTYENIELIICDDHSTDGTYEYICERMKEDSRIKYCVTPEGKKGANAARNTSIQIAKGKYIIFLDSDDYLLKDSIEIRVDTFKKNPNVALVYGHVYVEQGKRVDKWIYPDLQKEKKNQRVFLMENLALCCQISIMFRKSIINEIGLLDEQQKGWTDDGFVVAVGMKYRVMNCGKFVATARKSEISMTSNKWNMYNGCKMMVHRYSKDILKYASLKRYFIWQIRLFSLFCYAKEDESQKTKIKKFWKFLHEESKRRIVPYFRIYCE